uniref:ARAD1B19492p n=1 Tax=Blastobotrys adeninivorans TaxID=409370 RepID=A0A060T724_BLAAD
MVFWSNRNASFTAADVEAITRAKLDALSKLMNDEVYISREGVMTRSHAGTVITKRLLEADERLTIGIIASENDLSRSLVTEIVHQLQKEHPNDFLVRGDVVMPKKELESLRRDLNEQLEAEQAIDKIKFGSKRHIHLDVLEAIVSQVGATGLGNVIVSRSNAENFRNEFLNALKTLKTPTDVDGIKIAAPADVIKHLQSASWIAENVDRSIGSVINNRFVPRVYQNQETQGLLKGLQDGQPICLDDLKELGIRPQKLTKAPTIVLREHLLLQKCVDQIVQDCARELNSDGFSKLAEHVPEMGKQDTIAFVEDHLVPTLRGTVKGGLVVVPGEEYVVALKKNLDEIKNSIVQDFHQKGREFADSVSLEKVVNDSDINSISLHVVTEKQLQQEWNHQKHALPQTYIAMVVSKSVKDCNHAFTSTARAVIKERVAKLVQCDEAEVLAYLRGMRLVKSKDEKLYGKLQSELTAYASNNWARVDDNVKASLENDDPGHTEDILKHHYQSQSQVQQLEQQTEHLRVATVKSLQAQVQSAKDPALVLHLAVLIAFSSTSKGLLRATGKHVPKLIKLLQNLQYDPDTIQLFTSLKDAIVGGQPKDQLTEQVRSLVSQIK